MISAGENVGRGLTIDDRPCTRHHRLALAMIVILLAALAVRVAIPVVSLAANSPRLPQWDMAKNGVSGLRLARAAADFDPLGWLRQVNSLDVWPPLFPLVEAPVFFVFGSGYAVARSLIAALLAVAIGAAFWAGLEGRHDSGLLTGAFAAALLATSPMVHLFGTLVMLELPGTVLLLLAVGWYLRSLGSQRPRDFSLACVFATALFFCKYNYGLMWLLPMAANELWRNLASQGSAPRKLLPRASEILRTPWGLFLALGLLTAGLIQVAGPWRFDLAGKAVHISSAGNLVYALYAFTLLRWLLKPRHSFEVARSFLGRVAPRSRTMLLVIVLPIAAWMVVPAHTVNFVRFMENRSDGPPLLSNEAMGFYPRVLMTEYSAVAAIGAAVLLLGFLSLRHLGGPDDGRRVLALALLWSIIALLAHPYKLPRFAFTAAPLLWLAASREAASGVAWATQRLGGVGRRAATACLAVGTLVVASLVSVDVPRLERGHLQRSVPLSTRKVLDEIAVLARISHQLPAATGEICGLADQARSSVLLGSWNLLSPWLVEWHILHETRGSITARVPRHLVGRERRGDVLGRLAANSDTELVMVLDAIPDSAPTGSGYGEETAWLDVVRRDIVDHPRFILVAHKEFRDSGYQLTVYRPNPGR